VLNVTKTGIKIQEIQMKDSKPVKDAFKEDKKPFQKKVIKSKYTGEYQIYINDYSVMLNLPE
jgi:hypothetical protein